MDLFFTFPVGSSIESMFLFVMAPIKGSKNIVSEDQLNPIVYVNDIQSLVEDPSYNEAGDEEGERFSVCKMEVVKFSEKWVTCI